VKIPSQPLLKSFMASSIVALLLYSCSAPTKEAESNTEAAQETAEEVRVSFDFEPPKPIDGVLKGVIILGSAGFDAFTVSIDTARNWELIEARYGVSQVYENEASESAIKEGLQAYIESIMQNGVSGSNIYFLVSSSAKENEKVKQIKAGLEQLGYVVTEVSAEEEATYGYYATVPEAYRDKAFSLDIGSGNSKISWLSGDELRTISTYGSKYHLDSVDDKTVYEEFVQVALDIPEANIDYAFVIGGAPFKLAKEVRVDKERYTVLGTPESYTSIEDQKTKNGLNIYNAIRFSTKCESFVFDWNSNFAIGYLLRPE